MRSMFLIARREYLERIRTKAFLIMTILIPAIMGGSLFLPALFMKKTQSGAKHLVVVASDRHIGDVIAQQINRDRQDNPREKEGPSMRRGAAAAPESWNIDVDTNASDANRSILSLKVQAKVLDGVVWATVENLATKKVPFITRNVSSLEEIYDVQRSISRALQRNTLATKGLSESDIEAFQKPVDLSAVTPDGKPAGNGTSTIFTAIFQIMVLYMSVLLYGVNVMNAVLEEKNSRVMEVVLSTVEPKFLMAGKILGVGAVGLTQIAIWVALGLFYSGSAVMGSGLDLKSIISIRSIVFFVVFYLLGYLLYSAMYAAVGAMCNSQQEAQQLSQLVTLPMVVPLFLIGYIVQYPGAPLSIAVSMFPLTAPLTMYARIVLQMPPWYELAASIGLLVATIYGVVLLCGKIYRVGILMYGKKPTLPEIVKWVKYA
jgi:ABC-2 type transport system permease protein